MECKATAAGTSGHRPITIVGGGLAGLSLGIGLRRQGVPAMIWEAGKYPRHRVCGEFINGRGRSVLEEMGLWEGLKAAGARTAGTVAFYSERRMIQRRQLPEPGLCVSRFILDELLAREFARLGGELKVQSRWQGDWAQAGIVRATGRRVTREARGWRWIGLKAHARGAAVSADLEMHFLGDGYVGICQVEGGWFNACGLMRAEGSRPDLASGWESWLRGPANSPLRAALGQAEFSKESFSTVAGISLRPRSAAEFDREICVGDAVAMIPPAAGNGMSMALESGAAAVPWMERYSRGFLSWLEAGAGVAAEYDRRFARRLRWAGWLHPLLFQRPGVRALLFCVLRSRWCFEAIFWRTR